jgi:hypothetical protein
VGSRGRKRKEKKGKGEWRGDRGDEKVFFLTPDSLIPTP